MLNTFLTFSLGSAGIVFGVFFSLLTLSLIASIFFDQTK